MTEVLRCCLPYFASSDLFDAKTHTCRSSPCRRSVWWRKCSGCYWPQTASCESLMCLRPDWRRGRMAFSRGFWL